MWGFAWRDWVVVPHPALNPDNFGTGDLPARNAPQDGVLALWGSLAMLRALRRAARPS